MNVLFLYQPVQIPILPVPHPLIKLVKERNPVVPYQAVFSCLLRALVTQKPTGLPTLQELLWDCNSVAIKPNLQN